MKPLQFWLSGNKHYAVGVILYNTYGKDDALKKAFAKGATPYNKAQLQQSIEAIVQSTDHLPLYTPPADEQAEMPASNDVVLQAFRDQWLPLYKRMTYLQAQLDKYGSENSDEAIRYRHETGKEILEIEQQVMKVWQERDHYAKHGKLCHTEVLEVNKAKIPTDPVKIAELILNTRKYIRRYKQWIREKPEDAKRVKWVVKLGELEALLKQLTNGN